VSLNYKIIQQGKKHNVVETKTGLIIGSFRTVQEAKKLQVHLNKGGCFDGFTPTFFLGKSKF
jgi:hypothetical protein